MMCGGADVQFEATTPLFHPRQGVVVESTNQLVCSDLGMIRLRRVLTYVLTIRD
jgi:hypothetical protein